MATLRVEPVDFTSKDGSVSGLAFVVADEQGRVWAWDLRRDVLEHWLAVHVKGKAQVRA